MSLRSLEIRLKAVLKEFETLADSDPDKLRALIPPQEIWRLFVEDYKQKEYFALDSCLQNNQLKEIHLKASLKEVVALESVITQELERLFEQLHLSQNATESIR